MNAWDIDPSYQLGTWKELWTALKKAIRSSHSQRDSEKSAKESRSSTECCA